MLLHLTFFQRSQHVTDWPVLICTEDNVSKRAYQEMRRGKTKSTLFYHLINPARLHCSVLTQLCRMFSFPLWDHTHTPAGPPLSIENHFTTTQCCLRPSVLDHSEWAQQSWFLSLLLKLLIWEPLFFFTEEGIIIPFIWYIIYLLHMVNISLWFGSVPVPSGCRPQWETRQKRQDRGALRESSTELHPEAHMGLLDQHWTFHNLFCSGLLSFSLLGFELAVACVYTSCQFFSLRHTASLWNRDVSGIAGAQKCSSALKTPELFKGTNNHINRFMNWDTCFTTHIKSQY